LEKRLPIGSVITSIDGTDTEEYLELNVYPFISASTEWWLKTVGIQGSPAHGVGLLFGSPESEIVLTYKAPGESSEKEIRLTRSLEIPPKEEWIFSENVTPPSFEFKMKDNDIAYFKINTFATPFVRDEFNKVLPEIRNKAKAIIFDVRKNTGGNSSYGWDIGKSFFTEAVIPAKWKTRNLISAYAAWGLFMQDEKYRSHYTGNAWFEQGDFSMVQPADTVSEIPIAVLIGPDAFSAGEDFVVYMKNNPRAVFIGSSTAGSTGQPFMAGLPGGSQLAVTAKRDRLTDGTEFVGYGIKPDIEVENTLESFIEGRDLVLEKALEVLKGKIDK